MIRAAYVINQDGKTLYSAKYNRGEKKIENRVPAHIRACVSLFQSRDSTIRRNPYVLNQDDFDYIYTFFDDFAVVLETTEEEELAQLKRKSVSLGMTLAHSYGNLIPIWNGSMGDIDEIDAIVDHFVMLDISDPSKKQIKAIESVIMDTLESSNLAYVGVFDAIGNMVSGNIPENHLEEIRPEITRGVIKPAAEIVPTAIEIRGYDVQMLRVQSFTVVAAAHRDESKISATQAVGDMAHALSSTLS